MEATGAWQMSTDSTEPLPMPGVDIHLHFNFNSKLTPYLNINVHDMDKHFNIFGAWTLCHFKQTLSLRLGKLDHGKHCNLQRK